MNFSTKRLVVHPRSSFSYICSSANLVVHSSPQQPSDIQSFTQRKMATRPEDIGIKAIELYFPSQVNDLPGFVEGVHDIMKFD